MLLFYVRHGHPIYEPDSLTPLGERQAEAIGKRLALYGIDKIFSSPSNRAKKTAEPLSEILGLPVTELAFAPEGLAWDRTAVRKPDGNMTWAFQYAPTRELFFSPEVRALGDRWYDHPDFFAYKDFRSGVLAAYDEIDEFFASLGYEHERYTGRYRVVRRSDERIAFFAHQGFGLLFLSCLLDIPYPIFCTRFDMTHTGLTVIDFREEDGYAAPCICTLSDTGHIYKEGLPTAYNGTFRF